MPLLTKKDLKSLIAKGKTREACNALLEVSQSLEHNDWEEEIVLQSSRLSEWEQEISKLIE